MVEVCLEIVCFFYVFVIVVYVVVEVEFGCYCLDGVFVGVIEYLDFEFVFLFYLIDVGEGVV